MKILVCMKQTFDTEERIVLENGAIKEDGVRFVINPYDEYAVEEAVRLKESMGAEVTVVAVGPVRMEDALRTALAMGVDNAILADDEAFVGDAGVVAKVLAAVAKQGNYDLILAGSQAVDGGSSQVAVRLAEELEMNHVGMVTKLAVDAGKVILHRDAEGDEEIIEAALPLVVTAQQGLNEPRYPSLIGIRRANKKPVPHLSASDLHLTAEDLTPTSEVLETYLPKPKQMGRILSGELTSQVAELVQTLRNVDKVIQ